MPLAFQLLIYPMTEMFSERASRSRFGRGFYLTADFMDRAENLYLAGADPRDPRASVLCASLSPKLVKHLAPGYLVTAGFDPLRDEGEHYARLLEKAGVPVTTRRFEGAIHGFFNVTGAGRSAPAAVAEVVEALRSGLRGQGASAAARG